MRVLVTGGAGFIGSNFVSYLLEETHVSVVTLDALTYAGTTDNLDGVLDNPRHKFVEGDIRNRSLVEDLLANVDAIVHLAAETHVDRSIRDAEPFVETNVHGTQQLLDATIEADIDRFVQVSTDEVYGEVLEGRSTERDRLWPRNPYAATKASADHLAESYEITHDVPVVIARPSNNFGPRQHEEKLIPKFIERAGNDATLPVYGDGSAIREWSYVRDTCRALELLLFEGQVGEVYNISSNEERTTLEVATSILDTVDVSKELIEHVPDRPGHDQRYALDTTKMQSLGWEPQYSFEEGLQRTVEYYL